MWLKNDSIKKMIQKRILLFVISMFLFSYFTFANKEIVPVKKPKSPQAIMIHTGNIVGNPFCPGASIDIPYIISGGVANSTNIFTAQLSDSSGSFVSPRVLGTLTADSTDTIHGTIPSNAIPGTHYKIRIISSSPFLISDTTSFDIEILNLPQVNKISNDTICYTDTYHVTRLTAQYYDSVSWETSGDGVFSEPNAITTDYLPGSIDTVSSFVWLKLTAISTCGVDKDSIKLFFSKPAKVNAGPDTLICAWRRISLINPIASNYDKLQWTTSGTGFFSNANTLHPFYIPDTTDCLLGSVKLYLSAINNHCGTITDTIIVTFKQPISFVYAGANDTICVGNQYTFNNTDISLYNSILWSSTGTGVFDATDTIHPTYTPSIADTTAGFVNIILTTNTALCGIYKDTLRLAIFSLQSLNAGTNVSVCVSDTLTISGATASDYNHVHWTTNGHGTFINPNILKAQYIPNASDVANDSLFFIVSINSDCVDTVLTDTILARVFDFPDAGLADTINACRGTEIILTASTGETYLWSNGFTFPSMSILPSDTKKYKVTVTNACGVSVDSVVLFVRPTPELTVCKDTTIDFMFPAQLWATGGSSYEWTPIVGISDPMISNPSASPSGTTYYYVTAWDDAHICSVIDSVKVSVYVRDYDIFLPSAFSPNKNNGDYNNDIFRPLPLGLFGLSDYRMEIYNRWGQVVFISTSPLIGWNGIDIEKNQPFDIDTYLYKVVATDPYGEPIVKTGSVVLIK